MKTRKSREPVDHSGLMPNRHIRAFLQWVSLGYTVFVIYGSLVPLDYQFMPWNEAVARFRQIEFLRLGIDSRADWVANLLLFIPLAFLWTGALALGSKPSAIILPSLLVICCAGLLSLGIEFTQLYFPQRTVSLNDLVAEMLGGIIGVAVWWVYGQRFAHWLAGWKTVSDNLAITKRLTLIYLFFLFGYSLLPLDLTISPVEVYHKFREGKLNLLPFARVPHNPVHALYELASDALLWAVPAFLWRWSDRTSALRVWTIMTGAAALLECLQLFVYSRISDMTDIFTAALGAGAGVWFVNVFNGNAKLQRPAGHTGFAVMPLVLAAVWAGLIMIVFWYPFEFRTEGAFMRERLHRLMGSVPFQAYYFGSEYRAMTEVMHKVLFFIPLGMFLGWFVSRLRYMWRGYATWISIALIAGFALCVVAGRLIQPGKSPDIMDPFLQFLGGVLGFFLTGLMRPRMGRAQRAKMRGNGTVD
ncbi:MAG: VanZ family protein [Hydrogenophilaceae bacterium]|nr:VanZ family protein [Hydrogenophilaceae bacterium]